MLSYDRIILSHAHTDHWGGLGVLTERFPDARVFALDGIADQVRARGPARLDGLRRTYGDKAATKVTVPTEIIIEGLQRIDGVTYDFKRFVDAESDLQLAALLPEQKVLMAFDLVFSPNQHAFTGANHFDHWTIVLELLKAYAACAPSPRSSASKSLPSASRRPDTVTVAPSLAKASAVVRPMPVRAPVMRITGAFIVVVL